MKTKLMLLTVIALVSSVAFATEPGNPKFVVVNLKGTSIYKVIYQKPSPGKVRMNILDERGETIFTESIQVAGGFIRPVNFSGMAPGEYSIEIADGAEKQVEKVNHLDGEKVNQVKASTVNYVHVARMPDQSKYLFTVANNGTERINVRILDGAKQEVYDQDLTVTDNLGLVYNLKGVKGTPTFEVTDGRGNLKTISY